jgi:hypothetical protein
MPVVTENPIGLGNVEIAAKGCSFLRPCSTLYPKELFFREWAGKRVGVRTLALRAK